MAEWGRQTASSLCSVVKPAGSGRARKKGRGKHEMYSKQSTVEASLFVF